MDKIILSYTQQDLQTFPKANTKEFYSKALKYLSEYKAKLIFQITEDGYKEYIGVEVKISDNPSISTHANYIRTLLAGMGYTVEYDNDTITIK